jgi:hypothetical protein
MTDSPSETPKLCHKYVGDNDATCPTLHCIRLRGHEGLCDNVHGDDEPTQEAERPEPSVRALELAAQLWCSDHMRTEPMDAVFAREIALDLDAFARKSTAALTAERDALKAEMAKWKATAAEALKGTNDALDRCQEERDAAEARLATVEGALRELLSISDGNTMGAVRAREALDVKP